MARFVVENTKNLDQFSSDLTRRNVMVIGGYKKSRKLTIVVIVCNYRR
jgi:hypothetical protein